MNPKAKEERTTPRPSASPVSQRRPVAAEELTLYVPPPSVRAYALEHAVEPADGSVDVAIDADAGKELEIDIEVAEPDEASGITEVTRIVPQEAAGTPARARSFVRRTSPSESSTAPLEQDMFAKLAAHDYGTARVLAESILEDAPEHKEARLCRDKCAVLLEHKYVDKMGSMQSVPVVRMHAGELRAMALDPQAAFILSLIDGATPLETLLDLVAMPRLDALRLIYELSVDGVLGFE